MTKRGLRADELAQRIDRSPQVVVEILHALKRDGLVVRRDGRYCLSDSAEARFGEAFRELNRDEKDVA